MRRVLCAAAIALLACGVASAKEIRALRVCGATHCRVVKDPARMRAFNSLLWGPMRLTRAPTPRVGSPVFDLPLGAVITAKAIRVHGLNCGRFRRGRWYRLPRRLRHLGAGLEPRRLRAAAPPSC